MDFGLPYLGFGQCVKKVVVGHLVNSQPVVEDEQTFYTTEYTYVTELWIVHRERKFQNRDFRLNRD